MSPRPKGKVPEPRYIGTIIGGRKIKAGKLPDVILELTPFIREGWPSFLREISDDRWVLEITTRGKNGEMFHAVQAQGVPGSPPAWIDRAKDLIRRHVLGGT